MRVSFRTRLLATLGVGLLLLLALIIASTIAGKRVEEQLRAIRERFVPRIETGLQLEGQLESLRRTFQDAVASGDEDVLASTEELKQKFLTLLAAAGEAVDPADAKALRAALEEYYREAYGVSRRLMSGETGEPIVESIRSMQQKQDRVAELLARATALSEGELGGAFTKAAEAEANAARARLFLSVAYLIIVVLLGLWLSRTVLRSLSAFASGFQRFGRGEFDQPIEVPTHDEFEELAGKANQMALSLRSANRELQNEIEAHKRTVSDLEAFNYSVSHDLRTPLRQLLGFTQLLMLSQGDRLDAEARDYLNLAQGAAEKMGRVLDALLRLAHTARVEMKLQPVDLAEVANAIVEELRSADPARNVAFVAPPQAMVRGDEGLMRIVLENLLRNAWKFTRGTAQARLELGVQQDGDQTVYFIRDNGAGFDLAHADRLFEPFRRLHSAAEFEGSGLGLAIVKRIVERHGGRIWADSSPGGGATFFFTLPR